MLMCEEVVMSSLDIVAVFAQSPRQYPIYPTYIQELCSFCAVNEPAAPFEHSESSLEQMVCLIWKAKQVQSFSNSVAVHESMTLGLLLVTSLIKCWLCWTFRWACPLRMKQVNVIDIQHLIRSTCCLMLSQGCTLFIEAIFDTLGCNTSLGYLWTKQVRCQRSLMYWWW